MSAADDPDHLESPCLTARQAAAYLHLNEKKLYELANSREIPGARVGGKWLFPRRLLDEWLLEQAHGGLLTDRLLIAGSDDPLLAAAISALATDLGAGAYISYSPTGTLLGLELLAQRRINVCALHWGDAEHSAAQHLTLLRPFAARANWTLVRVARREQGVLMRPGLGIERLEGLAGFDLRWAMRQAGSGSRHFLASALAEQGFRVEDCTVVATAYTEREAAALVARGDADCAPGAHGAAAEFGLDFLPLGWEAFDLALPREIFFRYLFQQVLARMACADMRRLAARLRGYDLTPLGQVLPIG